MDEVRELYFGDTRPAPGVPDRFDPNGWPHMLAKVTNALDGMCGYCKDTAPLADLRVSAAWVKEARTMLAAQAKGDSHG